MYHKDVFLTLSRRQKKETQSTQQEDVRAEFYEVYRKEAEIHDKDFIKKYDEDLNTTLIFVRRSCFSNRPHTLT